MNFGQALEYLKRGYKLARASWNGEGDDKVKFIYLVNGTKVRYENLRNEASEHLKLNGIRNEGRQVVVNSHIDMKAADGSIVVGWLASQADMLSEDWEVINIKP